MNSGADSVSQRVSPNQNVGRSWKFQVVPPAPLLLGCFFGSFGRVRLYVMSLPPGAYYIAALSDEGADNWQDPSKLEAVMRGATRVTLADGQKLMQSLNTRGAR